MRVTALEIRDFRNIARLKINPHPALNLILGDNAQGKTNLLEAVWLCTGCRSFRGARESDFFRAGEKTFHIKLRFEDKNREQLIELDARRGEVRQRRVALNGVTLPGPSGLFERFRCVVFSPEDQEIIKGVPQKRRAFMDLSGSQLEPKMLGILRRFEKLTAQRNAVLRKIGEGRASLDALKDWDVQLAEAGTALSLCRAEYLERVAPSCESLYETVTGGREKLKIGYRSNVFERRDFELAPGRLREKYYEALKNSRADDARAGFTSKGAGRDDFSVRVDGLSAREFGSQGQCKSAALVLKLAQAQAFSRAGEESPVILLDDVMGELDARRQGLVYEMIRDMQVFLSACADCPDHTPDSAVFHMRGGAADGGTELCAEEDAEPAG